VANFGFPVGPGTLLGGPAPLPAAATLYSPQTPQSIGQPALPSQPNRSLGPAFANALPSNPTVLMARKFDPLTATILTVQGRHDASPEFLNCCRLLTHHDPTMVLTDDTQLGQPMRPHANLFPRQPTLHFRRDVLGTPSLAAKGYLPNFYNYVEALLSRQGILIESAYAKTFFTTDRIHALLSVESWAMSPQTKDLASIPAKTLHVYSFLQCLTEYSSQATLLLKDGISLLQAKHLDNMIPLLFRMINMKQDFITSPFDSSVLGTRLQQWSTLTDNPAIHHLWIGNPRLLTYLWFSTLREALFIIHCWAKAQRFHSAQGFFSATDTVHGSTRIVLTDTFPSHIPGQTTTLMEAFHRYDLQFSARWYDAAYSPHDQT
jgi:hypothetical protein